ncbi:hypothetical protein BRD17_05005 [Halobacteriales archaeon SW_7_68_16]|nr:MAG: hypothetical protein BRD17_05005 [Halobacteriales archaeon SW_7_68_16]
MTDGVDAVAIAVWTVAVVTYGVGDAVTTAFAVKMPGIEEANPVLRSVLGPTPSLPGLLALKAGFFALAVAISLAIGRTAAVGVPVGIVLVGVSAVVSNLYQLHQSSRRSR